MTLVAAAAFVPMITMLWNVNIVLEMQRTIQLCGLSKYLNDDGGTLIQQQRTFVHQFDVSLSTTINFACLRYVAAIRPNSGC